MTLAMAVKATTAGGAAEGAGLMLAFGLGTLPAMLLVTVAFARLGARVCAATCSPPPPSW
jgi:uncharacterized protein